LFNRGDHYRQCHCISHVTLWLPGVLSLPVSLYKSCNSMTSRAPFQESLYKPCNSMTSRGPFQCHCISHVTLWLPGLPSRSHIFNGNKALFYIYAFFINHYKVWYKFLIIYQNFFLDCSGVNDISLTPKLTVISYIFCATSFDNQQRFAVIIYIVEQPPRSFQDWK
jgi:hypothetical protein